ncbi:hypothetical protein VTI28DRAFT_9369 [Corynascus sepedonium]
MGSRFLKPVLRQIRRPFIVPTKPLSLRLRHRSFATSISAAELEFGQPVYETHPHILKPGEITPGITAQEYADRRAKLAHSLPDGAVAVLPSAEVKYRSGAVFYPFRQESNFLYLTGFSEPQSLAVIRKTGPSLGDYTFHLFCRPKDAFAEQWSGPWSGLRAAEDVFNADEAGDINAVATLLPPLLRSASRIYTDATLSSSFFFFFFFTTFLRTFLSPDCTLHCAPDPARQRPPRHQISFRDQRHAARGPRLGPGPHERHAPALGIRVGPARVLGPRLLA